MLYSAYVVDHAEKTRGKP